MNIIEYVKLLLHVAGKLYYRLILCFWREQSQSKGKNEAHYTVSHHVYHLQKPWWYILEIYTGVERRCKCWGIKSSDCHHPPVG